MKRIFVTGGNGFIGSVVVKQLLQNGYAVRCLLRPTSNTSRIAHLAYETALGDVRNLTSIEAGMQGCDGVIHLASLSNWNDINSPLMDEVVIMGTRNLLSAAMTTGKLPMVFVSSSAAVNGSENPVVHNEDSECTLDLKHYRYSRVKRIAEEACKTAAKADLPVCIVNPTEVYGPYDTAFNTAANLIDFAKSSPVLICKGGTSVVHVEDVAAGIIAALERGKPGERYILGGENLSVRQLAQLTLKILGQSHKRIVLIPNSILRIAGKAAQKLKVPFPINPSVIPYATLHWLMDNTKAKEQLKVNFRSAEDTLTPTLKWLQDEGHIAKKTTDSLSDTA